MLKKYQKKCTKINEGVRLIKWSHDYNGLWNAITDKDSRYMTPEMMRNLVMFLAKHEFYDIIFIMLSVHRDKEYVKTAYELLFKDSILYEMKKGKKRDIISRLLNYLH